MPEDLSRREFVARSALYGGAVWSGVSLATARQLRAEPADRAPDAAALAPTPRSLDPAQWRLVEAITARIIPTDHEPGAVEAGCVDFIDRALAGEDAALLPVYLGGLPGVEAVCAARHQRSFAKLSSAEQDAVLEALAAGTADGWNAGGLPSQAFFETIRVHTILGFLAEPGYGGNRGYTGWRVAGYPGPRHHAGGYTPAQMLGAAKIPTVWGGEL